MPVLLHAYKCEAYSGKIIIRLLSDRIQFQELLPVPRRHMMKIACIVTILLLGFCVDSFGQQPVAAPSQPAAAATVDSKLHENAIKFVELIGSRKLILDGLDKNLADGREKLMQAEHGITPQFADEWVKRMSARTSVDDYVNVIVSVYEKHFDNREMEELVQAQKDANDSKRPTFSPELKEKLLKENSAILSEVIGGCSQVGAKLGADIAAEIQKEHPDWVHEVKPSGF